MFQVGDTGKSGRLETVPSKKPNGANANFLQHLTFPVDLPEDKRCAAYHPPSPTQRRARPTPHTARHQSRHATSPLPLPCTPSRYLPNITLHVKDLRLGGLSQPIVGVSAVSLATKVPWMRGDYVPPASQQVLEGPPDQDDVVPGEGPVVIDVTNEPTGPVRVGVRGCGCVGVGVLVCWCVRACRCWPCLRVRGSSRSHPCLAPSPLLSAPAQQVLDSNAAVAHSRMASMGGKMAEGAANAASNAGLAVASVGAGVVGAGFHVLGGFASGAAAMASSAYRGAKKGGAKGFISGVGAGTARVCVFVCVLRW